MDEEARERIRFLEQIVESLVAATKDDCPFLQNIQLHLGELQSKVDPNEPTHKFLRKLRLKATATQMKKRREQMERWQEGLSRIAEEDREDRMDDLMRGIEKRKERKAHRWTKFRRIILGKK